MTPSNNKIIVSVKEEQKDKFTLGGVQLNAALKFETNHREKSPVIATVVEGNEYLREGETIVTHHNNFYGESPFRLYDNIYSIPFNKTIFAKILSDGSLQPICGNILCERVYVPTLLEVPPEKREKYIDRVIVTDGGWTPFKEGQLLYHRLNGAYEIVYNWNGTIMRKHKISQDQICGVHLD